MRYLIPVLALSLAAPAYAQSYSDMQAKIERMERDLTFLQRQVYQGGASDPNSSAATPALPSGGGNNAAILAQLSQMQEDLRRMRGQVEQSEYQAKRNADEIKKLSDDVDFRLRQIEQNAASAPAVVAPETTPAPEAAPKPQGSGFDVNEGATTPPNAPPAASYQPEASTASPKGFASPREHYNHAFKLLNDAKYADAGASFAAFTKDYPKDALTPNAYYWMGESFYARRDYKQAAEGFRKGYEAAPKGQKAPDNLLKLSLSLANLKRMDEACIVLKQVKVQYGGANKPIADKADSEYKRLGCA